MRSRARTLLRAWLASGALIGALFVPLSCFAQPVPAVRPMYFEHLTMRDGLSQSTVMSILQDSEGYLWLATESGLNRYDGYAIREYRRERGNEQGLANDYIWSIAEDAQGDLWLATRGGGLARWDRDTDRFQQFRHDPSDPQSLASDHLRTLLIDARGRVWVGTEQKGLDVVDPKTGRARHYRHVEGDASSLPSDGVFALHLGRNGDIWVGTEGGLSRYDPAQDAFIRYGAAPGDPQFGTIRVRALREDHTGRLWIGTLDGGLRRLDPRTGSVQVYRHDPTKPGSLSDNRVLAILEDDAHRLWVATSAGLNLLERTGRFVRYGRDPDSPESLRDDDIMSLYQDRGGVLWVGTRAGGASHWNPRSWALGHYRSALIGNTAVNAFAEGGRDKVWVGTWDGLVEIDAGTGRERRFDSASGGLRLPDSRVMALIRDSTGTLWIGTMAGGLQAGAPGDRNVRVFRHDANDASTLPADGVMSLHEGRNGEIWVGSFGGGLASIDRRTGRVTRYPHTRADDTGLSSPRASAIAEDRLGNLWIGTIGGGLNLFDRRTGKFHHYRPDDRDPHSLSDDTVYAVHVDANGDVWVGTAGGGVDKVVGSSADPAGVRFETSSRVADLPSQVVYGIESDSQGALWLSTSHGLARLDPDNGSVRIFHEAHGLQGEDFNFNAHFRGRDGTLYFGGHNGFNAFVPENLPEHAPAPRVVLTAASIMNRWLSREELPGPSRPLELAYKDKLVTFAFAALDFTAPDRNRYAYRLEGFDSQWNDAGRNRYATYTNLDAGHYVFRVRAANADGVWNEEGLVIPVRVGAAPWNTTTAHLIYAAVTLMAFGWAWYAYRRRRERERRYSRELEETVRQRTRELEERNAELQVLTRAKSDFLARMSHELRTPMNAVLGMSELLLDMQLRPAERRFVEGIHRSADSLLGIVDDVLDFSRIEAGRLQLDPVDCDLVELVEQTAEMLAARAAAKGVELLCDSPAHPIPRVRVDAVRLRQVLVNLGGNAVKFTEAGEVVLRLQCLSVEGDAKPLVANAATANEARADAVPRAMRIRLEVSDTGVGIEPQHQARIFDEFSQGDASTTRRFGGTGLGLSIVRQLVDLMGGTLSLVSAPGEGSTFSVDLTLPVAESPTLPAEPLTELRGMRVLVAMENATARALVAAALSEWGAQAEAVASIPEAVGQLQAVAFNAVLIDHSNAEGSSLASLREVLATRPARPRVVGVRSLVSLATNAFADEPWMDAELTKPLRILELCGALAGSLEDIREHRGSLLTHAPTRDLPPLRGRVLVVEDQPLNLEVAEGMLATLGLRSDTAADGQQALAKLATETFDIVLMDCQMPVMDGYAATAELRRREAPGSRIPVIALTADTTETGRKACAAAGMDDYLGKPFTRATLHAVLSRWLPAQPAGEAEPESETAAPLTS